MTRAHAQRLFLSALFTFAAASLALAEEPAVDASINATWRGDDTERMTSILEGEDREIYTQRVDLAAAIGLLPGMVVADVGSGSGFMVEEFARLVGPEGKVYAVDINPTMLAKIDERTKKLGLAERVATRTCKNDSVELPSASIDVAFVCDTYHHLEYPLSTMASIHEALRPGGELFVVEFHREEGESDEWTLKHVRAGQEIFTREIEAAGFELVARHNFSFLERNYILRFRKR
jgi:predicted methyltransferase